MALLEGLKLSDIFKASGSQAFALAVACGGFLYLSKSGFVPPLEPWVLPLVAFAGIFAGALWGALALRSLWNLVDLGSHWKRRRLSRARRKAVENYIPHMSEQERQIIGYLLERNQKSFDCDVDGGNAAPLIARGIIVCALRRGQMFDMDRMPMTVPDDVWDVLSKHRHVFPERYEGSIHPWRIHWMAR